MLLNQRLARLEEGIGEQDCSTCRGMGRLQVIVVHEGEEPDLSEAACPDCGSRSSCLKVITLVLNDAAIPGAVKE